MQQKSIHWFPGHMQKALREIEDRLKVIDVIIELLDARAPMSSRNSYLFDITAQKKRLLILTKLDLADSIETKKWATYFKAQGHEVLMMNLNDKQAIKTIEKKVEKLGSFKREKEIRRGMKPQPIRAMIVGIPNVGKSTLINRLSKRNAASVQNTPGHTKAQQWIKVGESFELLDTPGVLPPNYEVKEYALNLALIGSIKDHILPIHELCDELLTFLRKYYQAPFESRFAIEIKDSSDNEQILSAIAIKRGLLKSSHPDLEKATVLVLKEFKDGRLGNVTLERVQENVGL